MVLCCLLSIELLLGCSSFSGATGSTRVLMPLNVLPDTSAKCCVRDFSAKKSFDVPTRMWKGVCSKEITESLQDRGIFASVTAGNEHSARYAITGVMESIALISSTQKKPWPGPPNSGRTYNHTVLRAVVVMSVTLHDRRTGEKIFSLRVKQQGQPGQSFHIPMRACAMEFASQLEDALNKQKR